MNDEQLRATALQRLDQLTAGLARSDPAAVEYARKTLATIARDGTPNLLREVFEAITAAWEKM
jgi:hypothetical protein